MTNPFKNTKWDDWFLHDSNTWPESELVEDSASWWYKSGHFHDLKSYQDHTKCSDEVLTEMVLRHGDIKLYSFRVDLFDYDQDFGCDFTFDSDEGE